MVGQGGPKKDRLPGTLLQMLSGDQLPVVWLSLLGGIGLEIPTELGDKFSPLPNTLLQPAEEASCLRVNHQLWFCTTLPSSTLATLTWLPSLLPPSSLPPIPLLAADSQSSLFALVQQPKLLLSSKPSTQALIHAFSFGLMFSTSKSGD